MKPDRDPFGSLIRRLNEARAFVLDLERLFRSKQDLPVPAEDVGGVDFELLRFLAFIDRPVLLSGVAGPPAASIARFIHEHSPWGAANFLALRAASLKRGDIQSHLEDGRRSSGESGHLGTMYLDEITNLVPEVQEELIAHLEPDPGRTYASSVPIRLISSTIRSIEGALVTGDLSKRLYALAARIMLPIPLAKPHRNMPAMHRPLTTWIIAEVKRLRGSRDGQLYPHFLRLLQGSLIRVVLERTGGNQIRAARLLGVNRNTLRKWMRMLGGAA